MNRIKEKKCKYATPDAYFGGIPSPSCGGYGTVRTCSGYISCPICPECGQFQKECGCNKGE